MWRMPGRTVTPGFGDGEGQIANLVQVSDERSSGISFDVMKGLVRERKSV